MSLVWLVCVLQILFLMFELPFDIVVDVVVGLSLVLFPLSGLLGDVLIGRYRASKWGLIILWSTLMAQSITDVVLWILNVPESHTRGYTSKAFAPTFAIGCGLYLANSLHFGLDQIQDASSRELESYICWYWWCFFLASALRAPLSKCILESLTVSISTELMALIATIALSLHLVFHRDLVKEPTVPNPLRLLFQVLKFAARNKYPRLRSAYSYWDHKKSRLDLSKSKYGGPFTSEQVEDVKTCLRMICILFVGSMFMGYAIVLERTKTKMHSRFRDWDVVDEDNKSFNIHCFVREAVQQSASLLVMVAVPIFEYLLYPLYLWKYEPFVTTFKKFLVGVVLMLLSQLNYLTFEVAGTVMARHHNQTLPCLFNSSQDAGKTFSISFYWLAIPEISNAGAYFLLLTSTTEFICAQTPPTMKGLLIGLTGSFLSLSFFINNALQLPYKQMSTTCGSWYFATSVALTGVLLAIFYGFSKWYSRRRRRDYLEDSDAGTPVLGENLQHSRLSAYQ